MIPLSQPNEGAITFAQPDETLPFSERLKNVVSEIALAPAIGHRIGTERMRNPQAYNEMFGAAEQQMMLVEKMSSGSISREEAYDRRIKSIKEATGIEFDNPERYRLTERERRRLNQEGVDPTDIPSYPHRLFEQKLSELRAANPDKADALTFGDINAEAKAISKGAEDEYEHARKDTKLSGPTSLAAQFGGAMWGQRRDPLTMGTLLAGPTSAVGKTVAARIASAGLFQGLYNMGITALEQPVVQAWRQELGLRSGVMPAAENVGLAFVFGAIPGAIFRGVHEIPSALRGPVQRVLDGVPQGGDVEKSLVGMKHALGAPPERVVSPNEIAGTDEVWKEYQLLIRRGFSGEKLSSEEKSSPR